MVVNKPAGVREGGTKWPLLIVRSSVDVLQLMVYALLS